MKIKRKRNQNKCAELTKEEYIAEVKALLKREKRKKIIINSIFIILTIITISGFFWINQNKDFVYILNGESENFSYENAIFIRDDKIYYLIYGNETIKNPDIILVSAELKCGDRMIIKSNEFLSGSSREFMGYDELFPKEVVKNIDDWYFEIVYMLEGKTYKEKLVLQNELA